MVSVVNPKWSIPEGRYQVEMQVDWSRSETFEARRTTDYVIWTIPTDERSSVRCRHGRTLRAKIEQPSFRTIWPATRSLWSKRSVNALRSTYGRANPSPAPRRLPPQDTPRQHRDSPPTRSGGFEHSEPGGTDGAVRAEARASRRAGSRLE